LRQTSYGVKDVFKTIDIRWDGMKSPGSIGENDIKTHYHPTIYALANKFSNAMAERLNGKIQILKSIGRGYRTFDNFRSAIFVLLWRVGCLSIKKSVEPCCMTIIKENLTH
jgi:hypothetical protein